MVAFWCSDHEPRRAFARFTFPGADGRDHEIDLLVAGPTGCFLIEFEALRTFDHPGVLRAYDLDECDLAFVIAFEHTKSFVRLDHFMLTRGASLDFSARLGLLRFPRAAVSALKTLSDALEQFRCYQFGLPGKVKLKDEPMLPNPPDTVLSRCSWRSAIKMLG